MPTGGRWGSITTLKNQTRRLFSATVNCLYEDTDRTAILGYRVADKAMLWWQPKQPDQAALWQSTVTLSQPFFDEVVNHPVPVDLRALRALKRSPLALDIYCWLGFRMSYLRRPTLIPWQVLALQFGSDYKRTRAFREAFRAELRKVLTVYFDADADAEHHEGLMLRPSRPHIARRK